MGENKNFVRLAEVTPPRELFALILDRIQRFGETLTVDSLTIDAADDAITVTFRGVFELIAN